MKFIIFDFFKGLLPDNTGHLNFLHLLFFLQQATFSCSRYGQCSLNLSQNNLDCTVIHVIQLTTKNYIDIVELKQNLTFGEINNIYFFIVCPPSQQ